MSMQTEAAGSTSRDATSKKTPSVEKPKKARVKPIHPPISRMVKRAIKDLNNSKGSSVRSIKKYIITNFTVDVEKMGPYIKKYLARAVENKVLLQTKGVGLSGSYKLAVKPDKTKNHASATEIDKKILKGRKPASKQKGRKGAGKPMEKTTSKTSTASRKSTICEA